MATRFQHYVPQVYLRAWENSGYDETKGKAKNKGIYYYPKKDLRKGEPRNTNSILAKYHTYTVNYEYSFVFNEMPEIAKDYGKKIIEVLDKHNAVAFYDGNELKNVEQLTSKFTFPYLDEWEFVKRDNPENLARKKAILKDIKAIHSYVIENKLDDFLEKKWVKTRDDFIKAFDNFNINKICNYKEDKIQELLQNEKIIRNKLKINATINNSKILKKIQNEYGTFYSYLRTFTNDKIIYEIDQTTNDLSDSLSKDLKKRGMKFVGSTIIYSYLQAIGVIYSHDKECFMYKKVRN